jgi:hypothetical protein
VKPGNEINESQNEVWWSGTRGLRCVRLNRPQKKKKKPLAELFQFSTKSIDFAQEKKKTFGQFIQCVLIVMVGSKPFQFIKGDECMLFLTELLRIRGRCLQMILLFLSLSYIGEDNSTCLSKEKIFPVGDQSLHYCGFI